MIPVLGFILFGWRTRTKEYGPAYPHYCPLYDAETTFSLWKARRWFTLFFIPIIPVSRGQYELTCEYCGGGYGLTREQATGAKEMVQATERYMSGELSPAKYQHRLQQLEAEHWDGPAETSHSEFERLERSQRSQPRAGTCVDCDESISTDAVYCPQCGAEQDTQATRSRKSTPAATQADIEADLERRKQRKGKR